GLFLFPNLAFIFNETQSELFLFLGPDFIFIETLFELFLFLGPDFIFIETLFELFLFPGPGFIFLETRFRLVFFYSPIQCSLRINRRFHLNRSEVSNTFSRFTRDKNLFRFIPFLFSLFSFLNRKIGIRYVLIAIPFAYTERETFLTAKKAAY